MAPVGIVGVPYELDVTFWIPPTFQDNTTSLNVVLQELTLLNLERVPLGLTFEASSPTLTYYPQISPMDACESVEFPCRPTPTAYL
ncbi:MAG: hypothetical protein IPJ85_04900 [Flavobacteriales bacterium]|nr:hypothetical protein [Flavobacteriales bacterium]